MRGGGARGRSARSFSSAGNRLAERWRHFVAERRSSRVCPAFPSRGLPQAQHPCVPAVLEPRSWVCPTLSASGPGQPLLPLFPWLPLAAARRHLPRRLPPEAAPCPQSEAADSRQGPLVVPRLEDLPPPPVPGSAAEGGLPQAGVGHLGREGAGAPGEYPPPRPSAWQAALLPPCPGPRHSVPRPSSLGRPDLQAKTFRGRPAPSTRPASPGSAPASRGLCPAMSSVTRTSPGLSLAGPR